MADSGHIIPCTANDLKKNLYGMLKGHPCKIMDVAHSKTGKHGHAKCSITGIDVLTGKKYQDVQPAHAQMHFANVTKTVYQLMDIDTQNNTAEMMDADNNPYSIALEGEEAEKLVKEFDPNDVEHQWDVTVLTAPEIVGDDVVLKELLVSFKKSKAE